MKKSELNFLEVAKKDSKCYQNPHFSFIYDSYFLCQYIYRSNSGV